MRIKLIISRDIEVIERLDPAHIRIQFSGAYQQPNVVWDANIMSFKYYQLRHPNFHGEYGEHTALMKVKNVDVTLRLITIALPVTDITHAELIKTVVMVRNYRAMKVGLRQWSG